MQKHGLTAQAFRKIAGELKQQKLLDILFHYPDGPRYDIALHWTKRLRRGMGGASWVGCADWEEAGRREILV